MIHDFEKLIFSFKDEINEEAFNESQFFILKLLINN